MEEELRSSFRRWIEESFVRLNDIKQFRGKNYNLRIVNTPYGVKTRLDFEGFRFGMMAIQLPNVPTRGIASLCEPDRPEDPRFSHVVFIDYDHINEWMVKEELAWLVYKYKLTPFYLFTTKREEDKEGGRIDRYFGNYQAISLTKMRFGDIVELLKETHSDYNYVRVPNYLRYKFWVLRFLPKENVDAPKFLGIVPNKPVNMDNRVSRAHKEFLEKWYNVPKLPYTNLDDSEYIIETPYVTVSDEVSDKFEKERKEDEE